MSAPKRIWLSRDDERGEPDLIFQWPRQPRHERMGDATVGWDLAGWDDPVSMGIGECRQRYGLVPSPGTCVPIDLVPGEVIEAPVE